MPVRLSVPPVSGTINDRGEVNTTTRNYEAMYIVDTTLNDEQVDSIIERYSKVIADNGGEVQAAGKWDKRRLAYEINGKREGTYILAYFTGEPAVAKELDRVLRIADDILRHMIIRIEPQYVDTTRIEKPQQPAEAPAEQAAPAAEAAPAQNAEEAEQKPAEAEAPAQEAGKEEASE